MSTASAPTDTSLPLGRPSLVVQSSLGSVDGAAEVLASVDRGDVRSVWEEEEGGLVSARYVVEPSPGTHVIFWKGNWIRLDRVREQQQV